MTTGDDTVKVEGASTSGAKAVTKVTDVTIIDLTSPNTVIGDQSEFQNPELIGI